MPGYAVTTQNMFNTDVSLHSAI